MNKRALTTLSALMFVAASLTGLAATQAASSTQVGMLTCGVKGGVGMIIGSRREMNCEFRHNDGRRENYKGTMGRLGLDIGVTKKSVIKWAVFAPSKEMARGALEGAFSGVSGEVSIAVGLGGNVLVGGLGNSFALQPFSIQGQVGLNIAAGIARLKLKSVP